MYEYNPLRLFVRQGNTPVDFATVNDFYKAVVEIMRNECPSGYIDYRLFLEKHTYYNAKFITRFCNILALLLEMDKTRFSSKDVIMKGTLLHINWNDRESMRDLIILISLLAFAVRGQNFIEPTEYDEILTLFF